MSKDQVKKLVRIGALSGIITVVVFFLATVYVIMVPGSLDLATIGNDPLFMPSYFVLAGAGILGIIFFLGLYKLLTMEGTTNASYLAVIFGVMGFTFFLAMLMVQGVVMSRTGALFLSAGEEYRSTVLQIYSGLRSIDLALDLVWDIFISLSVILFGFSMLKSAYFGKAFGLAGIVAGGGLLIVNIITAPVPPANAGLVDLGPVLFIWFLAVGVRMLSTGKKL